MVAPSAKASCWRGSAANGMPRVRHSRVWRSIASGSLAPMSTRSSPPTRSAIGSSSMSRASRHRPGVEGRDLGHVLVGGADEAGGVLGLGDVHGLAVHAVALQPAAVVGEVLTDRPHEDRALPEVGHAEGDVGGHPAAADLEVVREEGQRDLVELLDDEGVGNRPLKVIRWSVAMDPVMATRTPATYRLAPGRPQSGRDGRTGRAGGAGRRGRAGGGGPEVGRADPAPCVADARTRECYPVVPACPPADRPYGAGMSTPPSSPRPERASTTAVSPSCARTAVRSRSRSSGPGPGWRSTGTSSFPTTRPACSRASTPTAPDRCRPGPPGAQSGDDHHHAHRGRAEAGR